MYRLYWNDQLIVSANKSLYKNANEMRKAFGKLLGVNPKYLRVDEVEVKEKGDA